MSAAGALGIAATAAFSALGLYLAWAFPRAAIGVADEDLTRLAAQLKALPEADRLARAAQSGRPWLRELVAELSAATGEPARAAAVGEALGELDHALGERERWPHVGVLLVWAGWLLATIGGALAGARLELLYGALVALVALGGCVAARIVGRRRAERVRRDVDAVVVVLCGELARPRPLRRRAAGSIPAPGRGPATPFGAPPD